MGSQIASAVIVAIGFIVAAFVLSGRYEIVSDNIAGQTHRLDKWTGSVAICSVAMEGCANMIELYHEDQLAAEKRASKKAR